MSQDAIEFMCREAIPTVYELEHNGVPFSRLDNGKIYQRAFGGQSRDFGGDQAVRTCAAADRTGHAILHTLFQQNIRARTHFFDEYFAVDLIRNQDGYFLGALAIEIASGEPILIEAKTTILATGGLGQIYLHMRGHLFDRERLQWLAADFATLVDPQTYFPDPQDMWKRTKGRQNLRGRQLMVLQKLAAWRETRARERDMPRKWVLKDEVIVELSRRMPKDTAGLAKIRGLEPGQIRREGDTLIRLIEEGAQTPREQWPNDKGRARPLDAQQEAMVDLLSAALRLIADEHQLSPMAVAPRKELEKLVRGEPDCILREGWREALAGQRLTQLLRGELHLESRDGRLQMTA